MKLLMRASPPVRMHRSGRGRSLMRDVPINQLGVISCGCRLPGATSAASFLRRLGDVPLAAVIDRDHDSAAGIGRGQLLRLLHQPAQPLR